MKGKWRVLMVGLAALVAALAGFSVSSASASVPSDYMVQYNAHVQNIGWQGAVSDGAVAGTVGQSLRMEALTVNLNPALLPAPAAHICYQAHVQNIGWQSTVCDGAVAGTVGQSLRMEAVRISLINAPGWKVCYQAHVQDIGWQSTVCNGAVAGTTGQSRRMEAIAIWLVYSKNPIVQTTSSRTHLVG